MEYPAGSVTSLPQGSGPPVAEDQANAGLVLLGLAGAYHAAQTRLSLSTERAARDLWLRMRPVTDADLSAWMDSYDTLLTGAARTQSGLTTSYVRASLQQGFGATVEPVLAVPASEAERVSEWLQSAQGRVASDRLRRDVAALKAKPDWTVPDQALANRLAYLHSPVIKQRWHLSEGMTPDEAFTAVADAVSAEVDAALRTVEADTVAGIDWPTFKTTGAAMVYKRVPQAGACGWCRVVATRLYDLAAFKRGRAWHIGCRCTWQPVTLEEAQRYAGWMKTRPGDYWGAAEDVGYWSGDRPDVGDRFDPGEAATVGYESRRDTPEEAALRAEQRAARQAGGRRASRGGSGTSTPSTPAALPGQVTQARLDSVRLQIEQLRQRQSNEWSRQRLLELADELEALLREMGQ